MADEIRTAVPAPSDGPSPDNGRHLHFDWHPEELLKIWGINFWLTLATLGIYYFWAKVKIRRYILEHTTLDGNPFTYDGSGKELLVGWIKTVVIFGIPLLLLYLGRGQT